jgi:hypothetical protein
MKKKFVCPGCKRIEWISFDGLNLIYPFGENKNISKNIIESILEEYINSRREKDILLDIPKTWKKLNQKYDINILVSVLFHNFLDTINETIAKLEVK